MAVLARLSVAAVDVGPGASASVELSVRNTGTVVDQFSFELLGAAAAWTAIEPPVVSLFPQAEQTVQVIFSPPRAPTTAAGPTPFGVRVESREDPAGSVVEEGTVNVAPFSEVVAELTPRAVRVRQRGRVQVLVDNRSNIAFRAELSGTDTDEAFTYLFRPPLVDVAPGSVAFTRLTARAKQRYWRGPSTTQPFQAVLRPQGQLGADGAALSEGPHPPEIAADGAIVRDPILPGWLPKALLAALAVVVLAALLWFELVKPQIKAAAQNQVAKAIKPISQELGQIRHQISTPPTVAPPPSGTATTTTTAVPPTTSTTARKASTTTTTIRTTTTTRAAPKHRRPAATTVPVNASLVTGGNNTTATFVVPRGKTLAVTDFLLENSAGNSGNLELERNGVVLMSWALANFRDLDYHWITPIYFGSRSRFQLVVNGCRGTCTPGLYYAGNLTTPG